MNQIPEPDSSELQHLIKLVEEANHVGSSAASMSAERLRKCVQVGAILLRWKQAIPKGKWQSWLNEHLPEDLNERTRRRWMQLAIHDAQGTLDLESARGLRHAYQLAQLLPEGDSTGSKPSNKLPSYIVHLNRLVAVLSPSTISGMNAVERSTLKQRLSVLIKLHSGL